MKRLHFWAVIIFLAALLIGIIGCGSSTPYTPPPAGDPRATISITNNCRFTIYVMIDETSGGYIYEGKSKSYEVTPGSHTFELTGTDEDYLNDVDYPVYFETSHIFVDGEKYSLPVRFGVD